MAWRCWGPFGLIWLQGMGPGAPQELCDSPALTPRSEHAGTRCLGMEILGDGRDFQVQSLMAPLSLPATRRRWLV